MMRNGPKARGIRTNSDKRKFPYKYQAQDRANDKSCDTLYNAVEELSYTCIRRLWERRLTFQGLSQPTH